MHRNSGVKKKQWIWFVVSAGIIALAAVLFTTPQRPAAGNAESAKLKTATVGTGSITKTVTSTGTLEAQDTVTLTAVGGIKINDVLVKAGDAVKAGQPIASLDTVILGQTASKLLGDITNLNRQLSRMNGQTAPDEIKAPVDGRVMRIFAQKDSNAADIVAQNGSLIVLSTDGKMRAAIKGVSATVAEGQRVTVQLENGRKVTGHVGSVLAGGTDCVVTLDDKGTQAGEKVSVYSEVQKLGEGTLEINKPLPVIATGGKIDSVEVKLNEEVSLGDTLVTITDEPSSSSYDTQYYALQDKLENYTILQKLIQYPMLVSPIDGVISDLNIQDQMIIAADSAVAKIHTNGLNVVAGVDELDMPLIKMGQEAVLTLDSLPGKEIPAKIVKVSPLGISKSGATTYDVTLDFQSGEPLYEGMNVTANITVDHRDNAILIPLEALQESSGQPFVYMEGTQGALGEIRNVTTGISDGTYVEILNGLAPGESIVYVSRVTDLTQQQQLNIRPGQFFNGGGSGQQSSSAGGQ